MPGQPITLEDVYAHTALTYASTWTRELTGREILTIMEDVADNLFHPDPYYRQGGDMVRLGGLTYAIDPEARIGRANLPDATRIDGCGDRCQPHLHGGGLGVRQSIDGGTSDLGRGRVLPPRPQDGSGTSLRTGKADEWMSAA